MQGAPAIGGRSIPLAGDDVHALIYWYGPYDKVFRHFPVWQVFNSALALNNHQPPAISPAEFRNKIVLIGPSASGIGDLHATPLSAEFPGVDVNATVVSNLLQNHFVKPVVLSWSLAAILLLALATSIAVWQFNRWPMYTGVTLVVLGGFMGVNFWLFWSMRISLADGRPLAAAATSFAAGNLGRYVTEGREKRRYASTLIRYVAPSIVEAMMKDRRLTELSNEKRDLTVLFSTSGASLLFLKKCPSTCW